MLKLPALAEQSKRPEEIIAGLKAHPAIAPLVEGGELKEYSAHLIPEGGLATMPKLSAPGLLVAGRRRGACLAAGIWLEGVNFAIGSGMAAGAAAPGDRPGRSRRPRRGSYRRELGLRAGRPPQAAPGPDLVLSERVQQQYPSSWQRRRADVPGRQPRPKPGLRRIVLQESQRAGREGAATSSGTAGRAADVRMRTAIRHDHHRALARDELRGPDGHRPTSRVAERPHHRRRPQCAGLLDAACVVACPANLFVPTADGGILFNYEQCFECGTCYLVCNAEGAITWTYPEGGHGVVFHHS